MAMAERPLVREISGGKCWEHEFGSFYLKAYVPDNNLDGQVNNYGFRAPLLLVFEEERQEMEQAAAFARETGREQRETAPADLSAGSSRYSDHPRLST